MVGDKKTCPVVAIVKDGKILMGLRHYTPDKWKTVSVWTIPGGRCDVGEKLEATLRRETAEEVGITDLRIDKFLGKVKGAKEGDEVYVFLGVTEQGPKLMEPDKFSEWRWFGASELPINFINDEALNLIKNALHGK